MNECLWMRSLFIVLIIRNYVEKGGVDKRGVCAIVAKRSHWVIYIGIHSFSL